MAGAVAADGVGTGGCGGSWRARGAVGGEQAAARGKRRGGRRVWEDGARRGAGRGGSRRRAAEGASGGRAARGYGGSAGGVAVCRRQVNEGAKGGGRRPLLCFGKTRGQSVTTGHGRGSGRPEGEERGSAPVMQAAAGNEGEGGGCDLEEKARVCIRVWVFERRCYIGNENPYNLGAELIYEINPNPI